jgi:hypothetical protein
MIFSIPYQLKLKILPIYLIKINYFGFELWKSGDLKRCWKISLPKHALITTIYLYYILYVFITCLYVMFYQSSTLSLLWVYICNFTICVISVCPSRAHNWNKIYSIIWFDLWQKFNCLFFFNNLSRLIQNTLNTEISF